MLTELYPCPIPTQDIALNPNATMIPQRLTLTTDDGQTINLTVTSVTIGEAAAEPEVTEQPGATQDVPPLEKLRRKRAAK